MSAEAAEARRLRAEGMSIAEIQRRLGVTKHRLTDWLRGMPAPAWTARPNAKDELHGRAVDLRGEGWSVNDIALELGVARSTAWQWVKHLPLDRDSERARAKRAKGKQLTEGRWAEHRLERDQRRATISAEANALVGELSDRDLLLVGAVAYWCEGEKAKPWRPGARYLTFINSDPMLIELFLRFLEVLGRRRAELSYRISIHESADVTAAQQWWAESHSLPVDRFLRPTLKRHHPKTVRHNVGDGYHGCLVIRVPKSADDYCRVEAFMQVMTAGVRDVDASG